ncbi:CDGSH iron-sulfur domain-containing protein 3, mitochondrial [Aythya fuligula]|uniref:CDGSH iron-sulfur domain-containing protein 3, mitochondrial n=1 Tax=Aythya fuligula TaxID=219594 RepID=A0A6J3E5I1_AYTFU|nr:CDGSH iron-sulfur domain-containing protein 3, mitochondrial [Aythya fuligula]
MLRLGAVTLRVLLGGRARAPPGALLSPALSSAPSAPSSAPPQPLVVELKAGKKYAWCSCGHSKTQPFCDGSHRTAAPGVSPLRFTAEADGAAPLCACKRTRTPPFCDGSHREQAAPPGPRP